MSLRQEIKQYYFDNLEKLSPDKQFHFASRMAAWERDLKALAILRDLRPYVLPSDQSLGRILGELLASQPHNRINAYQLRQSFFNKYPKLYGRHSALFRVRHLKSIYGIDASNELYSLASKESFDSLADELANDNEALRLLSTFAINYLYLYKSILLGEKNFVDLKKIINLKSGYDLSNPTHLQLLIYLYTHCIIGETNFYTEKIEPQRLPGCKTMLKILEALISANFDYINLDNKLEFLVCYRICDYDTKLFEKIHEECEESLSDEGHFLVDRHNKNVQETRKTFDRSEHRNVLYLMSCSAYQPRSTLIG